MEDNESKNKIPTGDKVDHPVLQYEILTHHPHDWPIMPFVGVFIFGVLIQTYKYGDFGSSRNLSMHVAALWDIAILLRWVVARITRCQTNGWIAYIALHLTFTTWFPFLVNWILLLQGKPRW